MMGDFIHNDTRVYYARETVARLRDSRELVIFGARIVAREVALCLMGEPYGLDIAAFMVTDRSGNPDSIVGIPVIDIREGRACFQDAVILVAVLERYLDEILACLQQEGFSNVIPLTFDSDLWSEIRGNYFRALRLRQGRQFLTLEQELEKIASLQTAQDRRDSTVDELGRIASLQAAQDRRASAADELGRIASLQAAQGRQFLTLEQELEKIASLQAAQDRRAGAADGLGGMASLQQVKGQGADDTVPLQPAGGRLPHIYMAKCHVDRELKADISSYDWEIPIQAGAALTDRKVARIRDDQGENISKKNREYCELTALYWIWKNDRSDYVGLCHYRRHFDLDRAALLALARSDIDVVVTLPVLNFPDVRTVYGNDHCEADWAIMMEAIAALHPEYRKAADELQNGVFYYAYNMFIARREVFDHYCAWLFPILDHCEKKCEKKEDPYQNRFIGFLAERLLTIYLLHHEGRYKIVYAKKRFLMG